MRLQRVIGKHGKKHDGIEDHKEIVVEAVRFQRGINQRKQKIKKAENAECHKDIDVLVMSNKAIIFSYARMH